jgi:hypothetical protein
MHAIGYSNLNSELKKVKQEANPARSLTNETMVSWADGYEPSDQPGNQIGQEIVHTAMTRMGNLGNVLQLVVDRFNNRSFVGQQLV